MNRFLAACILLCVGLAVWVFVTVVGEQPYPAQYIMDNPKPQVYEDPYVDRARRVQETKKVCLERGGVPIYGNVSYEWIERCDFPVVVSK